MERPLYQGVYHAFHRRSTGATERAPGTFDALWTITNAQPSTLYTSRTITVIGIAPGTVITGTDYSINGAAYTSAAGTINPGDKLWCQGTSSASYSDAVTGGVVIGGVACSFIVETMAEPVTGFPYTFPFTLE